MAEFHVRGKRGKKFPYSLKISIALFIDTVEAMERRRGVLYISKTRSMLKNY